jgi:hypothetical protein
MAAPNRYALERYCFEKVFTHQPDKCVVDVFYLFQNTKHSDFE